MVFTAFGLITKGMNLLNIIGQVPAIVQVIIFTAIIACVIMTVIINNRKVKNKGEIKQKKKPDKPLTMPPIYIPTSQRVYANVLHWVTLTVSIVTLFVPIFMLVNPANNVLNPNMIFTAVFNGASPSEIWALSKSGIFPGAHFYLQNIFMADSWAMLTINIGCAVGLIAAIPAVLIQFFKEKDIFNACLGTAMATLIFCAITRII